MTLSQIHRSFQTLDVAVSQYQLAGDWTMRLRPQRRPGTYHGHLSLQAAGVSCFHFCHLVNLQYPKGQRHFRRDRKASTDASLGSRPGCSASSRFPSYSHPRTPLPCGQIPIPAHPALWLDSHPHTPLHCGQTPIPAHCCTVARLPSPHTTALWPGLL